MSNNTSLQALKAHLFEALEGVKNLSDSNASECEKTSIEQAKAIVSISGRIIDTYKVQLSAVKITADIQDHIGPTRTSHALASMGLINEEESKLIE